MADRALLDGTASAEALVLTEPLSFWGGLDTTSGAIVDRRHPQVGEIVAGKILVMPNGRGSSSSSSPSVLAEAIRLRTAPAGIVLGEADEIVLIGALVAEELYGFTCPIVVAEPNVYTSIATGQTITIGSGGLISIG